MNTPRDPVQFTRESADRIASLVRQTELAEPAGRPLSWMPIIDPQKVKILRVGTFDGSWPKDTQSVVTFENVTTTPNTASVMNFFYPLDDVSGGKCLIAKENTSWYLVSVPMRLSTVQVVDNSDYVQVVTGISTAKLTYLNAKSTAVINTFSGTSDVSIRPCETNGQIEVLTDVSVTFDPENCSINVDKTTQTIELSKPGDEVHVTVVSDIRTAVGISVSATQTAIIVSGATVSSMIAANSAKSVKVLAFEDL